MTEELEHSETVSKYVNWVMKNIAPPIVIMLSTAHSQDIPQGYSPETYCAMWVRWSFARGIIDHSSGKPRIPAPYDVPGMNDFGRLCNQAWLDGWASDDNSQLKIRKEVTRT